MVPQIQGDDLLMTPTAQRTRKPKAEKMPAELESEFQAKVIETARLLGYRVAHFRPALTKHGWRTAVSADGAGFFDLVMVNPVRFRVIYAELKSETGKLSPEQKEWADAMLKAGQEVYCWKPNQFDEVAKILQKKPEA
jgi:hypothetical protein